MTSQKFVSDCLLFGPAWGISVYYGNCRTNKKESIVYILEYTTNIDHRPNRMVLTF